MAKSPANNMPVGRNAPKLPLQQLTILAICRFAEPVAMTSVYPYIPEMIKSFGVPTKQVARYAGLLSFTFSGSQALVGISWGRASDRFGRKPMILLALTATMISSVMFGFSTSLTMAFVTRSMQGLSAGNVGIIRTAVAELVPQRELQPMAFSVMPLVWTIGSIFGPSIGGGLVKPSERYPSIFGGVRLLERYPFAFPNLLISFLFMIGIVSGILFLHETLADREGDKDYGIVAGQLLTRSCRKREKTVYHENDSEQAEGLLQSVDPSLPASPVSKEAPAAGSWSSVFQYQSNLNLAVYTFLAMHSVAFDQLLPVFLDYDPVQTIDDPRVKLPFKFQGGFDLDSGRIGTLFTIYGIYGMFIQFLVFPPTVRRFGVLKCYKCCAITLPIIYLLTPYISLFRTNMLRQGVLLFLMLIKGTCSIFAFPCTTILLTNSASSVKVLGTLNGVATSISAVGRAAGPALAGATFSLGVIKGYMVLPWWTLAFVATVGAIPAWWLVETDGFGGDKMSKVGAEEDNEDGVLVPADPVGIATKTAPAGLSVSPADDIDLLEDVLPDLQMVESRQQASRHSRKESFGLKRI